MLFKKTCQQKSNWFFWGLFLVALGLRFYNLGWGNGYFFHPDERNMAISLSRLSFDDLNPRFFAYGQLPLYWSFFTYQVLAFLIKGAFERTVPYPAAVLALRFWSAVASLLTVAMIYVLGKELKLKRPLWGVGLAIFAPGLLQIAHFGTTEAALTLVLVTLSCLSSRLLRTVEGGEKSTKLALVLGITMGAGLATKVSALAFGLIPAFVCLKLLFKKPFEGVKVGLIILGTAVILGICLSPFNLLNWQEFWQTMQYEISVAQGNPRVFYTRQFEGTVPILFQLEKILPFVLGWPMLVLALGGVVLWLKQWLMKKGQNLRGWLPFLLGGGLYLGYQSFLYAKWTRFIIPGIPLLILLAAWLLDQAWEAAKKKPVGRFLLRGLFLAAILPGVMFFKIYLTKDVRLVASEWLNKEIGPGKKVFSEAGNVADIPLGEYFFETENFDFYTLEHRRENLDKLLAGLWEADYLLVPSRRIFANYRKNSFPITKRYYDLLVENKLGFEQIAAFSDFPKITLGRWQWEINDEGAEESFTVFDHPVVRVYRKTEKKTREELKNLFPEEIWPETYKN